MPTFARAVAALAFAALAFFASEIFKPLMPEGTQLGLLSIVNAGIGFLSGWIVMGPRTGQGYYAASGTGVRTSATFFFFALLGWSIWTMIQKSLRPGTYSGAADALNGAMDVLWQYAALISLDARLSFDVAETQVFIPQVFLLLVVGGIMGGWLAEWAQERAR